VGAAPFRAVPLEQLVEQGYAVDDPDGQVFFAPDESILLSDEFLARHCLSIDTHQAADDSLFGVAFAPAPGRQAPDIRGTVWLDRSSHGLRRVEFEYVGLDRATRVRPWGGEVVFASLPSGEWFVSEWGLRLPVMGRRASSDPRADLVRRRSDEVVGIREYGARASAADRAEPEVREVTVRGVVIDRRDRNGIAEVGIALAGTDHEVVSDSAGAFMMTGVRPGTYRVEVTLPGPSQAMVPQTGIVRVDSTSALAVRLEVDVPEGILESLQPRVSVFGTVVSATGALAGAEVRLGTVVQITDRNGRFRFEDVEMGTRVLETRHIGYSTRSDTIALGREPVVDVFVTMETRAIPLEPIAVTVFARPTPMGGFLQRRENQPGVFLGAPEIDRQRPARASDILAAVPGLRPLCDGSGRCRFESVRSAPSIVSDDATLPGCPMEVYLDGVSVSLDGDIDALVRPTEIGGLEIYRGASETPTRFSSVRSGRCGALVIWTRP
jgi:hypothetical protein